MQDIQLGKIRFKSDKVHQGTVDSL